MKQRPTDPKNICFVVVSFLCPLLQSPSLLQPNCGLLKLAQENKTNWHMIKIFAMLVDFQEEYNWLILGEVLASQFVFYVHVSLICKLYACIKHWRFD